jgi:diguanylate cyclase (GGDEF)-like protein
MHATLRRLSTELGLQHGSRDVYPHLEWALTVRVGGTLWLIGTALVFAALPAAPPTHVVGDFGWMAIVALATIAIVTGVYMVVRGGTVRPYAVLWAGYAAVTALALVQIILGENAPFAFLILLTTTYQAAIHPPRRVLPLALYAVSVEIGSMFATDPSAFGVVRGGVAAVTTAVVVVMTLIYARWARDLQSELAARRDRAEELARTDSLTGLGNRRAFDEELARSIARGERYSRPLSLVMFDIDGFKSFNDRHGHAAGDAALTAVADALRATVRLPDTAFRWGGDEFFVVLPETAPAGARAMIDRVYSAIARGAADDGGRRVSLTAGVAEWRAGEHAAQVVARADAALMATKRGRARMRPSRPAPVHV